MKKNKRAITSIEALLECILEKIVWCETSNKRATYIFLDKKTFKLFKSTATIFMPSIAATRLFGIKIKVVKSKEQIICVGY